MSGSDTGAPPGPTAGVALTVLGPAGALDLLVPAGASVHDVAVEYAGQAGVGAPPTLCDRVGEPLAPHTTLDAAGIGAGALVVALAPGAAGATVPARQRRPTPRTTTPSVPGPLSVLWCCLGSAAALLAGWFGSQQPPSDQRTATVVLLVAAAAVGVLPVGRRAAHRTAAAPAFAASAAFAVAGDPTAGRLPAIVALAALAAAATAAAARALAQRSEEALRVWMAVGATGFAVTGGTTLLDLRPQVAWAVLLVTAMLAARLVPLLAVDVPDRLLLDLDLLAVTAWSARDRATSHRGRTVVPSRAVETVAARGARTVVASSVAILAVVVVSAPLLLATATARPDDLGARLLVGSAGGALLVVARSHRHAAARALLRLAGLACWAALLVVLLGVLAPDTLLVLGIAAVALAVPLLLVSVALGRGWRSVWWSRRAEVAEAVCGSVAVGAVVPAAGLFRHLWTTLG